MKILKLYNEGNLKNPRGKTINSRKLNIKTENALINPNLTARQLHYLITKEKGTGTPSDEMLTRELKEILAPDVCHMHRCETCAKCHCSPEFLQSKRVKNDNAQKDENLNLREAMSVVEDNENNLRICVRLPINVEQAEKLLRGTNKNQIIKELDSKLKQLSEKAKILNTSLGNRD